MSDVLKQHASGAGPISETLVIDEGKTYQLVSVTLNVGVAPTTSENFTLTKRAFAGDVYDVPLYILDLSIIGVTVSIADFFCSNEVSNWITTYSPSGAPGKDV